MFRLKTALSSLLLCFTIYSVFAQKNALSKIDASDLRRNLTFVASDDLQGRKLGTEVDGLGIAANYLAENAKAIGLKSAGGTYFQKVEVQMNQSNGNNSIELTTRKGKVLYKTNALLTLREPSHSVHIESEKTVFIGFGDADVPDVEAKIVVLVQGNAESYKKEGAIPWNNSLENAKIKAISEKNPEAIVIVTSPKDKENKTFTKINNWFRRERYRLKASSQLTQVRVLLTLPDFADKLLGGKGKLEKYLGKISAGKNTDPVEIEQDKIGITLVKKFSLFETKNVIGIVEGSDPRLKDECVVFMAHYDHLGVAKNGEVYNGADDNGSGTVAIMEVAEAFASLVVKPKRSIVFLWVSCEEVGHLGAAYYCNHPVYPLRKTVAAINLDMVGRVFEPRDSVWNHSPKKVKNADGLYTLSNDVWPQLATISKRKCKELGIVPDTSLPKQRFLGASDHYHFHKNGVPVLNFSTGYHADYHKVSDEIGKINFGKIKRVADLCFLLGYEIANLDAVEF